MNYTLKTWLSGSIQTQFRAKEMATATHQIPDAGATTEALPRRRLVFAIVSMALFMSSVDQTIVATALPAIQHDLHSEINWSLVEYAVSRPAIVPLAQQSEQVRHDQERGWSRKQ